MSSPAPHQMGLVGYLKKNKRGHEIWERICWGGCQGAVEENDRKYGHMSLYACMKFSNNKILKRKIERGVLKKQR